MNAVTKIFILFTLFSTAQSGPFAYAICQTGCNTVWVAFRAGHYKDLTETGNRARKVSGTQGSNWPVNDTSLC